MLLPVANLLIVAAGLAGSLGLTAWPVGVSALGILTAAVLTGIMRRLRNHAAGPWRIVLDDYADRRVARTRARRRLDQLLAHARGAVARPAPDRPMRRTDIKEERTC